MTYKEVLKYPLKIFSNDWVLKSVIHSVWIMAILLGLAKLVDFCNSDLFKQYEFIYSILKGIFNTYISIAILGYFISKYKFCVVTLVSFYMIVFLRLSWFVNEIHSFNFYKPLNITVIALLFLSIIVYKLKIIE